MFSIGIVDVTTVGSTICQRRINELGGSFGDHPEFVVHSQPWKDYYPTVIEKDWQTMAKLVSGSINKLNKVGVDFIIVPSNTPHYAYQEYAKNSAAPVLNLIEITAEACEKKGLKRVAILGTKATMMGGLYQEKIEKRGVNLVVPLAETCEAIHQFIMQEIVCGQVQEETRQKVLALIKNIDCDGFILGCTELPEAYNADDLEKPAIDTTRLLAEVAFDIAMHEKVEEIKRYTL